MEYALELDVARNLGSYPGALHAPGELLMNGMRYWVDLQYKNRTRFFGSGQ